MNTNLKLNFGFFCITIAIHTNIQFVQPWLHIPKKFNIAQTGATEFSFKLGFISVDLYFAALN